MHITMSLILFFAFFFSAAGSLAQGTQETVSALQERYEKVLTIVAVFSQFSTSPANEKVVSEGKVYFKKPGKMRWQYSIPHKDELVSDGRTVWFYQPDLNQALATPVSEYAPTLATDFLSGILNIKRDFEARTVEEKRGVVTLELIPKEPQPGVKRILLRVDRKENLVRGTTFEDAFGGKTEVNFSRMEVNTPIKDSFFEFKPPKGVNVIKR